MSTAPQTKQEGTHDTALSQHHALYAMANETQPKTEPERTTIVPLRSTNPPSTVEVRFEKLGDICDDTYFDHAAKEDGQTEEKVGGRAIHSKVK